MTDMDDANIEPYARIELYKAEVKRLTAKVARLESRGIEDMKDEIARLRAALVEIAKQPNHTMACPQMAQEALGDDA